MNSSRAAILVAILLLSGASSEAQPLWCSYPANIDFEHSFAAYSDQTFVEDVEVWFTDDDNDMYGNPKAVFIEYARHCVS